MKSIVVADHAWNIGKGGQLLVHLPKDLAYFKKQTHGKTVIMGRLTYDSLPGQKPLSGRTNIVLTRDPEGFLKQFANQTGAHQIAKVIAIKDEAELLSLTGGPGGVCTCCNANAAVAWDDIFVIGGGQIYELLLPYCDEVYVTKLDKVFADADTVFPNLDAMAEWEIAQESEMQMENGISYRFMVYRRKG